MRRETDLAVAGAGVAGLAVATALARQGARVTVLERAAALGAAGAGIQISPNGAAVLAGLGLGDWLAAAGHRAEAVVLADDRTGRGVLRLDLGRRPERTHRFVCRSELIAALAGAARAAGVELRLGCEVLDATDDGTGVVLRTVAGGAIRAAAVLGADGLRSRLRGAVGAAGTPAFTGHAAWRARVPDPGVPAEARVHMGPGRHLVSYPLGEGTLNLVAVHERRTWTAEGWHHRDDPANLRAAFADVAPEPRALLAAVDETHVWGLFRHPVARRWHRRGVAILGDAAHPALPFLAQGANMALEDAWVLTACLCEAGSLSAGFAAFERARLARARRIVAASARNARAYHLRPAPARRAAHAALRLGGALAPGLALARFDWLYGFDATRVYPVTGNARPVATR